MTGTTPADSKGRLDVTANASADRVGGVVVRTTAISSSATSTGCLAVPRAIEDEVIERALAKVAGENTVRDVLAAGASIQQVFREHGIL